MAISDKVSRTIKCEGEGCPNEVTFDPQVQEDIIALPAWVRTTRTVQLGNRSSFTYCSDVCEVKGVTTGNHNVPEPKAVEPATAQDQKQAEQATDVINKMRQRPGNPSSKKVTIA